MQARVATQLHALWAETITRSGGMVARPLPASSPVF